MRVSYDIGLFFASRILIIDTDPGGQNDPDIHHCREYRVNPATSHVELFHEPFVLLAIELFRIDV